MKKRALLMLATLSLFGAAAYADLCKTCQDTCNDHRVGDTWKEPWPTYNIEKRVSHVNPHRDCVGPAWGTCSSTGPTECYKYEQRWWNWATGAWGPWGSTLTQSTATCT